MDNKESNIRMSGLIFEAMNKRDFSELDPYLSEDVKLDFPGSKLVEGRRKFHVFMKALLRGYPVLEFTVLDIICSEKSSVVVWTNKGHDKDNTPYSNSGMTLVHHKENKILFVSDYFKDTSFIR